MIELLEIIISAPIELRVMILAGIVICLYELIKREDNNAEKGHK